MDIFKLDSDVGQLQVWSKILMGNEKLLENAMKIHGTAEQVVSSKKAMELILNSTFNTRRESFIIYGAVGRNDNNHRVAVPPGMRIKLTKLLASLTVSGDIILFKNSGNILASVHCRYSSELGGVYTKEISLNHLLYPGDELHINMPNNTSTNISLQGEIEFYEGEV